MFAAVGRRLGAGPHPVHGYIQGRFTDPEGVLDQLEIRRARLIVFGDPFSELSYNVQVDVLKKPYLLGASLTWKPDSAFQLTAGQFKIPFSSESLLADNLEIPIERARARKLARTWPGHGRAGARFRSTGVR
jgi:phosphate-selective porin OprO and OprP